ncbi:MFS transporter [bacterium]|nr:MFS transporter [bacterium]
MMPKFRWIILIFLFLISVITYVDRINISVAGAVIAREFRFSQMELGAIFSTFLIGYALFQIVGGWLGDKIGHKRVLAAALVWWSVFTALTAWVGTSFLAALLGIVPAICCFRFLIGAGEAAAYPCSLGLIRNWFPADERGRATGIIFSGIGVGCTITPPLVAWMMVNFEWQSAFYIAGTAGLLLAILFYIVVPERPVQVVATNDYKTPWRRILKNEQVWLLTLGSFFGGYVIYIFFFWFYLYLIQVRGFELLRGSFYAALPFVAMTLGSAAGGILADRWSMRVGKVSARRWVVTLGLFPAALLIYIGAFTESPYWAIAALALAAGFMSLVPGCSWAASIEIEPSRPATIIGITNTGTNLGGALSPILTSWISEHYGWGPALAVASFALLTAGFLWRFIGVEGQREIETQWRTEQIEKYPQKCH